MNIKIGLPERWKDEKAGGKKEKKLQKKENRGV
jgi:hypothetical protein